MDFEPSGYCPVGIATATLGGMRGNVHHQNNARRQTPKIRSAEAIAPKLLDVIVYDKCCWIGGTLDLDELTETSGIGDWKMSDFETARSYAVAQGWLIIEGNNLRLTTAGLAAA